MPKGVYRTEESRQNRISRLKSDSNPMKNPEIAKKNGELRKDQIISEEQREAIRKRQTGKKASDSTKAKLRELIVKRNKILGASLKGKKRPKEVCDKIGAAHKGKPKSPEQRKKLSIAKTGTFPSKETRIKLGLVHKGSHHTEEVKRRISNAHKGKSKSEEGIMKRVEGVLGGFWYGNVRYYDYPLYCEKFNNEFRNRVRAYFNYVCPECGTPQSGRKLAVHHVNYNKKSCCDPNAPRLFIPLCIENGCHNKTNKNREYYEKYFTEMLMGYYQGKCYFTPEEMISYHV